MAKKKKLPLEPENFELQCNTIWAFPDRGKWATHDAKFRGNWSPYIPRNVILRYSEEGDTVLDQFVGGGTTLVETKLLQRNGIGIDINQESIELTKKRLDFKNENKDKTVVKQGDARNLDFIKDDSVDLILTHPPYSNIIKYSENIPGDLSLLTMPEYLEEMKKVAEEAYRVLKEGKYCAILMGDTRKRGHVIPLGFQVMTIFQDAGFILKEIIIKEQHNCKTTGFWRKSSIQHNFLLLAHEYLYIFHK